MKGMRYRESFDSTDEREEKFEAMKDKVTVVRKKNLWLPLKMNIFFTKIN
ncbi:hypothetical protein LguiB_028104 [Lonicera macranthoides]